MTDVASVAGSAAALDVRVAPPVRFAVFSSAAAAPTLVGTVVLAVALYAVGPWPVGVFYDDGIYLILAKALATGDGYRYLNLPGHPAATHYPPGYPALLAILWRLAPGFPANVTLFKCANAVLLAAGAGLATHFGRVRLRLPTPMAAGAVLTFTLAIPVLAVTAVLFAEPLFLVLLLVTLLAAERLLDDDGANAPLAIAVGMLAGITTLVRSIGIAAVVGVAVALVARRRPRAALLVAAATACAVLPWQLWVSVHESDVPAVLHGSYGSYLGWFADAVRDQGPAFFAHVAARNVQELLRPLRALFTPGAGAASVIVLVPLLVVALVGARALARRAPATALCLATYLTIVVLWPYLPDRFLWGIWPLVGLVFALGVSESAAAARRAPWPGARRAGQGIAYGTAAAAILCLARTTVHGYAHRGWESAQRQVAAAELPFAEWVATHAAPGDVVATPGDPLVYLYTGRTAVPPLGWTAAEYLEDRRPGVLLAEAKTVLRTFGVRYLLVAGARDPVAPLAMGLQTAIPPVLEPTSPLPNGGTAFTVLHP